MNKALGTQFNTRAAEIRLAAKLVGKLTGLKNWRAVQVLISPTFYKHILLSNTSTEEFLIQTIIRERLK